MDESKPEKQGGPQNPGAVPKRNFSLHIPPDKKEKLQRLAQQSGLPLNKYVDALLTEAIEKQDVFVQVLKKKIEENRP